MRHIRVVSLALVLIVSVAADVAVAGAGTVLDRNVMALETTAGAPFNPPLEAPCA